jgi:hypothetical protein
MRSVVVILAAGACSSHSAKVAVDASEADARTMPDAYVTDAYVADAAVVEPLLQGTFTYFKASDTAASAKAGSVLALSADGDTLAVSAPFDATETGAVYVFARSGATWAPQATLAASNAETYDWFGYALALSRDGSTLVASAQQERSCATGVGGDQADNACAYSGAVYVFTREVGGAWSQQAYLKAAESGGVGFGTSVAVSADGNVLAAGAVDAGIGGSVYTFRRSGATWAPGETIVSSNHDAWDGFGRALAMSAAGDVIAASAGNEASDASGVNGNQADNSTRGAGAVYVFHHAAAAWHQDAYIKASNPGVDDVFGFALALSASGSVLAVGAPNEASGTSGINGDQSDNSQVGAGAVYAFAQLGGTWVQQAYIKEPVSRTGDGLGWSVSLSADGDVLAAGASGESRPGTGLLPSQQPGLSSHSGAAHTYLRTGQKWTHDQYLKAPNADANDWFGTSIALSADARVLAVGSFGEASSATGVNGDMTNNSMALAGAAYVVE